MQLTQLGGLWLLSLALPLVLLYLLKAKRVRRRIASTLLWKKAARELKARHPFQRLKWVLPLVLQLLALVCLALAATRPFSKGGQVLTEHSAIIIDVSASMQTTEGDGNSRLSLAKDAARSLIERKTGAAEVMLVTAGSGVRVVSPFERDRVRLLQHIAALRAEDAEGSLAEAVELAAGRLRRASGKRKLLLLTDGELANRAAMAVNDLDFEIAEVGGEADNVGIVHVDARNERASSDSDGPTTKVRVFARVHNFGEERRNLFVTLRLANVDEPLASRSLQVEPNEDAPVVLTFDATPQDRSAGLIVELSPPDAFDVDDRAFLLVPESRQQQVVLLREKPSPWLSRALLADTEVDVAEAESAGAMMRAGAGGAFLIYVGSCPETLPSGHFLIVAPPEGDCLTTRIGERVEYPKVTSWRESDPRLRFLTLGEVQLQAANPIEVDGEPEVLVRANTGVVMSQLELQGRIGTIVGFDFGESDWPLKASFVLFVRNLVEQAREHRLGAASTSQRAGVPPLLTVPLDVRQVEVTRFSGLHQDGATPEAQRFDAKLGLAMLPPFTDAGFHHAAWRGGAPGSTLLAVSLTSEKESDLREKPLPKGTSASRGSARKAASDLWDWTWVLALVALGLFVAEVSITLRNRSVPKPPLDRAGVSQ